MKFRNYLLMILPMLLLHFFTGCSDNSGEGMEDLTPATGNIGNKVVLYEANPKIFARTNALAAITTRLDEIKSLGTTVLWLMPIYEQGGENAVGSPYCVKDYKKLNAGYGTLDDVKTLVARAHEKGKIPNHRFMSKSERNAPSLRPGFPTTISGLVINSRVSLSIRLWSMPPVKKKPTRDTSR